MGLFRANDRHPVDPRILIITDMDEFHLWRERAKLGIHGIVCDYPAPMETLQEAAQEIVVASKIEGDGDEGIGFFEYDPGCRQAEYRLSRSKLHDLPGLLRRDQIGPNARAMIIDLVELFHQTVTSTPNRQTAHLLRVNSQSIGTFHNHEATLTFSFAQNGSVCCTGNAVDAGDIYTVEQGKVLVFDETVWHKSPSWEDAWEEDPRVNLVL